MNFMIYVAQFILKSGLQPPEVLLWTAQDQKAVLNIHVSRILALSSGSCLCPGIQNA